MSRPTRKKMGNRLPQPTATKMEVMLCKLFPRTALSQSQAVDSQALAVSHKRSATTTKIKQLFKFCYSKTQPMATKSSSALPKNESSKRASAATIASDYTCSEATSEIFSMPPSESTTPSSTILPIPANKNPIRRLLGKFIHPKRISARSSPGPVPVLLKYADPEHGGSDEKSESKDEDTYSDNGESDEEDEYDRRDFRTIRKIPRKVIEDFVLELVHPGDSISLLTCHVMQRKEGSFHHAIFLCIEGGEAPKHEFVLKIPAHGTAEHWDYRDAFMLRNEADLMQHIRYHTACPVPKVIAYDGGLDNAIGAPYILMEKMPGMSALDLWLGQPYKSLTSGEEYRNADSPSPETELKRIVFLRSLAHAMSRLQSLKFKEIGTPVFDDAENCQPEYVGPMWRWHSKSAMYALTPIGPFDTGEEYFLEGLDEVWNPKDISQHESENPDVLLVKGVRKILDIVFSSPPFAAIHSTSPTDADGSNGTVEEGIVKKIFVLRHDDLDLQNILVDNEGNVTGIIDWDGCMSAPQCIGYTSLPTFLRRDWLPEHTIDRAPHMTWSLNRYRDIYTKAMEEYYNTNGNRTDAMFTRKSSIYQALLAAVYEDEDVREVVGKLLVEIPECRHVDKKQFYMRLGAGWPAAEAMLREKIPELLRPE